MTERSVNHATFVVERRYPAHPAKVFGAWADAAAKSIWMDDPDYTSDGSNYELDFRIGGHERFGGLTPEGAPYSYDAVYYDIGTPAAEEGVCDSVPLSTQGRRAPPERLSVLGG